jgi:RHS repeat-associated protein
MDTTWQLIENSHQGFEGIKASLCLASMEAKSNTASGMPVCLWRNGIRSRSSGKERDAESGLDYFGARYLSAAQGRWTSPDRPFADQHPGNPQSWNLYVYVSNNPLNKIDPNGEADYFIFLPEGAANLNDWKNLQNKVNSSKSDHMEIYDDPRATAEMWNKAIGTADARVIFVGHITHPRGEPPETVDGVLLANRTNVGHLMPDGGKQVNQGEVKAALVALFGCYGYYMNVFYGKTEFVGVGNLVDLPGVLPYGALEFAKALFGDLPLNLGKQSTDTAMKFAAWSMYDKNEVLNASKKAYPALWKQKEHPGLLPDPEVCKNNKCYYQHGKVKNKKD